MKTKAKSNGAALRNKRLKQRIAAGRPRKEGERYPSGDIKRSETQKDVLGVVTEARVRLHNIPIDLIRDQKAGSTLGRMCIDKKVTDEEYKAGFWYAEEMERYYRATGIQSPNPRAQDLFAIHSHDGEVSTDAQTRARKASSRFIRLETVLLSCQSGPQVRTTVFNVCIHDIEHLRMMSSFQLDLLKRGLQALMFEKALVS